MIYKKILPQRNFCSKISQNENSFFNLNDHSQSGARQTTLKLIWPRHVPSVDETAFYLRDILWPYGMKIMGMNEVQFQPVKKLKTRPSKTLFRTRFKPHWCKSFQTKKNQRDTLCEQYKEVGLQYVAEDRKLAHRYPESVGKESDVYMHKLP